MCPSLEPLTNPRVSYSNLILGVNTVATYTCEAGYTLDRYNTRTCGSNGVWSGSDPSCLCKCFLFKFLMCFNFRTEIVSCSDLTLITNGDIVYTAGSPDNRPFSSSATYNCSNGYTLIGGTTRVCVSEGRWNGSASTCQGELCELFISNTWTQDRLLLHPPPALT